jgi:hypothetical protein
MRVEKFFMRLLVDSFYEIFGLNVGSQFRLLLRTTRSDALVLSLHAAAADKASVLWCGLSEVASEYKLELGCHCGRDTSASFSLMSAGTDCFPFR